jgi:peptidoglycan/xylan/chitin deacetylase (PgdA/CDA1 family)
LVGAAMAAHGLAAGQLLVQPEAWPEAIALVAASHGVLACGMHPRSALIGRNMTRLPAAVGAKIALTFDDGPDPATTPRLLDILSRHDAQASFFVVADRALRNPALVREIAAAGHDVENHTFSHPLGFAAWGPWRLQREIARAQETIANVTGRAPRFFRAPMGLRNPLLDPVLARAGLRLVSWTRRGRDSVTADAGKVLARLTHRLAAGDILMLHDGPGFLPFAQPIVTDQVLPHLLAAVERAGLRTLRLSATLQSEGALAEPGPGAAPA